MMLTKFRTRAGVSQAELARRLGVVRATVNGWERGKRSPKPEQLIAIADVLGCTVDELVRPAQEAS